jgi:hypothetical protein
MNFNDLMAKMRELDQPVQSAPAVSAPVEECGEPMMNSPMSAAPQTPPHQPPSLSVNLNAQGMDDIESIMKLMTKVNPDMINQKDPLTAMPGGANVTTIDPMAMLTPPGPSISGIGDLGDLDKGPLKMLPDFDKEPEGDDVTKAMGDLDGDGDHDMDDHDMEKDKPEDSMEKTPGDEMNKDDKEESSDAEDDDIMTHLNKELKPYDDQVAKDKESKEKETDEWANTPTGSQDSPEYKDTDYMIHKLAGGMNGEKQMYKHNYRGGDNPMSMKEDELRAYVKSELSKRLAEARSKQA